MLGEKPMWIDSTPHAFADAIERLMSQDLPDVDYHLEQHSWADRAEKLLRAIQQCPQASTAEMPVEGAATR